MALTAGTLIDGARMYAAAADAVNDKYPNSLHVLSHLLGMSLELAFKAFLVHRGYSEPELRKHGHDLRRLLEACEVHGLTETGSRHFRVSVLGANYQKRIFGYPAEAMLNVILPSSLREITREIVCEVFIAVKGQQEFHRLENQPGLSVKSTYPDDINPSGWAGNL